MTGVSRRTFELMVDVVKADEKKKKKPGRRTKLIIEDQVLMLFNTGAEPTTLRRRRVPHLLPYWIRLRAVRIRRVSRSFKN